MVRTVKVSSVTTCEWYCVTHQHFPLGAFESELFPLVTKGFAALSSEAAGFSSWNSLLEAAQQQNHQAWPEVKIYDWSPGPGRPWLGFPHHSYCFSYCTVFSVVFS